MIGKIILLIVKTILLKIIIILLKVAPAMSCIMQGCRIRCLYKAAGFIQTYFRTRHTYRQPKKYP